MVFRSLGDRQLNAEDGALYKRLRLRRSWVTPSSPARLQALVLGAIGGQKPYGAWEGVFIWGVGSEV